MHQTQTACFVDVFPSFPAVLHRKRWAIRITGQKPAERISPNGLENIKRAGQYLEFSSTANQAPGKVEKTSMKLESSASRQSQKENPKYAA